MALRAGCDDAVRVHDVDLEEGDYLGVARAIAAVAQKCTARLVLCGDRSQDERQGATGPAVAELLGAPHLIQVVDLRVDDGVLLATQRGGGKLHSWRCPLPAVMCMAGFPRTRPATGEGERSSSGGGGIAEMDLGKLGLAREGLGARGRLVGPARPTRASSRAVMLASPPELVERLARERLIG
jgi:electron transfer flavoprotein beta subunit